MTHLPVRHPDDLARYYRSLGERRGAIPAQRIADAVGEKCKPCGGGPPTRISNGDQRPGRKKWRTVCATCGEPWSGEEIHVLRQHEKTKSRPRDNDGAWLEDWRRLQPVFENRPRELDRARWDFCMVAWLAFLAPTIGTYERASDFGVTKIPGELWTPARVRGAVDTARAVIQRRGTRAGLIVDPRLGPRARRRMAQESE